LFGLRRRATATARSKTPTRDDDDTEASVTDEVHGFTRRLGQFTVELILTHGASPKNEKAAGDEHQRSKRNPQTGELRRCSSSE